MFICNHIVLTPKGFALLEGMSQQLGPRRDVLGAMLARKLEIAQVVPASGIDPDVATLNSRVRFRIGLGPPDERTLVRGASPDAHGATLPVGVPRGLAMLGMRAGQTVAVPKLDGRVERLTLEAVLCQPGRPPAPGDRGQGSPEPMEGALPAPVTSFSAFRAQRARAWSHAGEWDDLPPGAA